MRLLIIEDDFIIAQAMADEFRKRDYDTVIVEDFLGIMYVFDSYQPHLVLIDVNLPYYNGYYWCSQIRTVSNVPIIFISSLTDKMDQMIAMQMGTDDYIPKPIDRNENPSSS